jgi:hypothetical protein
MGKNVNLDEAARLLSQLAEALAAWCEQCRKGRWCEKSNSAGFISRESVSQISQVRH